MANKYSDALSGLSTAPVGSPLHTIRYLAVSAADWDRATAVTNQISQIYPTYFFALFGPGFYFNGAYSPNYTRLVTTRPLYFSNGHAAALSADGDEYEISFPLGAGDYYLNFSYIKFDDAGKVDIYFDDVKIYSLLDCYAGSTSTDNQLVQAFTCASDGSHTLTLIVNGKNGSSSDYRVIANYVEIVRA